MYFKSGTRQLQRQQTIVNKRNSMAGAVRVEANLPGDIRCLRIFYSQFIKGNV